VPLTSHIGFYKKSSTWRPSWQVLIRRLIITAGTTIGHSRSRPSGLLKLGTITPHPIMGLPQWGGEILRSLLGSTLGLKMLLKTLLLQWFQEVVVVMVLGAGTGKVIRIAS